MGEYSNEMAASLGSAAELVAWDSLRVLVAAGLIGIGVLAPLILEGVS